MKTFWYFAHWINRIPLLAAVVIFTIISSKYIIDPVGSAAPFGISLNSPTAITNVRVGFGAFPLGFAIILLASLISKRRLIVGLWFVVTIFTVVTAARILGIVVDGASVQSLKVLRPEVVLVAVSIICLFIERRRSEYMRGGAPGQQPNSPPVPLSRGAEISVQQKTQ